MTRKGTPSLDGVCGEPLPKKPHQPASHQLSSTNMAIPLFSRATYTQWGPRMGKLRCIETSRPSSPQQIRCDQRGFLGAVQPSFSSRAIRPGGADRVARIQTGEEATRQATDRCRRHSATLFFENGRHDAVCSIGL